MYYFNSKNLKANIKNYNITSNTNSHNFWLPRVFIQRFFINKKNFMIFHAKKCRWEFARASAIADVYPLPKKLERERRKKYIFYFTVNQIGVRAFRSTGSHLFEAFFKALLTDVSQDVRA